MSTLLTRTQLSLGTAGSLAPGYVLSPLKMPTGLGGRIDVAKALNRDMNDRQDDGATGALTTSYHSPVCSGFILPEHNSGTVTRPWGQSGHGLRCESGLGADC